VLGTLSVYYAVEMPSDDHGHFLKEETKLIHTIAEHLGDRIQQRRIRQIIQELETSSQDVDSKEKGEWSTIIKMIKLTDRSLYEKIARKILNHLCWSGIAEAEKYAETMNYSRRSLTQDNGEDWNRPSSHFDVDSSTDFGGPIFAMAADNLNDRAILELIHRWIQEDKLNFLVQVVNRNLPIAEITDAIRRIHFLDVAESFSRRLFSAPKVTADWAARRRDCFWPTSFSETTSITMASWPPSRCPKRGI